MDLRDHLRAIYDKHGKLTPALVVQEARKKSHPLHAAVFDKPVAEAAEAYYHERAHELIRKVFVVYREGDESSPAKRVRGFHAIPSPSGFVYEPAEKVAEDPFMSKLVVQAMEREFKSLEERYGHLTEFISLCKKAAKQKAA